MARSDGELGMGRDITRRDFIHGVALASLALSVPGCLDPEADGMDVGIVGDPGARHRHYPPTLTGIRGSHPGSFEVAHELAWEGRRPENPTDLDQAYDLVVVGGGISGLAAAHYYRKRFGDGARILVLDNHDDFGGHAKRNEFHQGGEMRLAWGGTFNLEYPWFSDTVNALMEELGIDVHALAEKLDFHYGSEGFGPPAMFFDEETYGRNVLVRDFALRFGSREELPRKINEFPLSREARDALIAFYQRDENVLEGMSEEEADRYLRSMSYLDFLRDHGGLPEEAVQLFVRSTHGYAGSGADLLSVAECRGAGLPMLHLLGQAGQEPEGNQGGEVAQYPDGNATIARLLVRAMIPDVADGRGEEDIALQTFDYSKLDRPDQPVRIRLSSTVLYAENDGNGGVDLRYANGEGFYRVRARHCVLACFNAIIPDLCSEVPEKQAEALRFQIKRPLLVTNVLLRSSAPFRELGISGAYCPGRIHGMVWPCHGVNTGGYRHDWDDGGSVPVQFWGSIVPPEAGLPPKEQHRASRHLLLTMSFQDFEREVRTTLDGMLSPAGFDVAEDVLAITVNRWPHGYSYRYMDLWDAAYAPGQHPHEIARRPIGNITIANSDAGASSNTQTAIDQAYRAVSELGEN
jgi:spermidine dehydrogenase